MSSTRTAKPYVAHITPELPGRCRLAIEGVSLQVERGKAVA
ncbi:hypothetical protein [Streptomyces sp. Agncl-13]